MKHLSTVDQPQSEQLSLFDFGDAPASAPKKTVTIQSPSIPAVKPIQNDTLIEEARNTLVQICADTNIAELISVSGLHGVYFEKHWRLGEMVPFHFHKSGLCKDNASYDVRCSFNYLYIKDSKSEKGNSNQISFDINVVVMDENGDSVIFPISCVGQEFENTILFKSLTLKKEFRPTKIYKNTIHIQSDLLRLSILENKKPWIAQWIKQSNSSESLSCWMNVPYVEILDKAGFALADKILSWWNTRGLSSNDIDIINRLCQFGTKPKNIFKTTKTVYTALKDERCLDNWDIYRIIVKTGRISEDDFQYIIDRGWDRKHLTQVNSILAQKYNGKPVFTMEKLVHYLGRLDMYEAIDAREALQLLYDYLHMCHQLDMPPRIDGDSLKREHDIAARLIRTKRDEQMVAKMQERKALDEQAIANGDRRLEKSTYRENLYFVEPIYDYDKLLDEARQQHNCVACYADRIVEGKSRIYTLRYTDKPQESLVTIELSPDCRTVRQKFLAYNHPIRSRSISEFIDRWMAQMAA